MSPRSRQVAFAALVAGLVATSCAAPAPANAWPLRPTWELGAIGGWTMPDAGLADYQWDVTPEVAWGGQALAALGPVALGLRYTRSATTQALGEGASVAAARVRVSAVELVARGDVARFGPGRLYATGTAGRLHLGYDPDRVTIDAGSGPVEVELAPVGTWAWGGGVGVARGFGAGWSGALELAHRRFSLETAHRNGSAVEYGRRGFGEWDARFVLGWRN